MTDCSSLTTAICDLRAAIVALTDELSKQRRQREQDLQAIVALHKQKSREPEEEV